MKNNFKAEIRKISTRAELENNTSVIEMLNDVVSESEKDLNYSLSNSRLKNFTNSNKAWQVTEKWLVDFEKTNKNILVAELNGRPQALLVYMINDSDTRSNLNIDKNRNFVIGIKAITKNSARSTGILSALTAQMLAQTDTLDAIYISCTANKSIIDDATGKESFFVMNLERYAAMHQRQFLENNLQVRYKDREGNQFGREKIDLNSFFRADHSFDNDKINSLMSKHVPLAKLENKEILGLYIVGDCKKRWTSRIENERAGSNEIISRL